MRVLFACELGVGPENFHLMKMVAAELRSRLRECEVILATSLNAKDVDISWADKGFSTPKFAFRHQTEGEGVIQQLHYLGWTTDELRQIQFNNWRTLMDSMKPTLVICCNAPGASLVATMLGHPCLDLTAEPGVDPAGSLELFPELDAWAYDMVDTGIVELMNRPGVSFISALVDPPRPTMMLNASPFARILSATDISGPLLVLNSNAKAWHQPLEHLKELGVIPHKVGIQELYSDTMQASLQVSKPEYVIGAYDYHSTALALSLGVPYLGMPGSAQAQKQAALLESGKRSYRLSTESVMIDFLLSSMPSFTKDAAARCAVDNGGFCSLEVALDMIL